MNGMPSNPPPLNPPKTSGLAVASLVLGVLAFVTLCFGPLLAIPAIICGHIAFGKINGSRGTLAGKGLAIAGFTIGYASLLFMLPLLLAIAIPNFVRARQTAQMNACVNNLRKIDAAKQQWALANKKKPADTPTMEELKLYEGGHEGNFLHCPAGGTYTIHSVAEPPTCSLPQHQLP